MKKVNFRCKDLNINLCHFCLSQLHGSQQYCMAQDLYDYFHDAFKASINILKIFENVFDINQPIGISYASPDYRRFVEPVIINHLPQYLKTYQTFLLLK